MRPPEIFIVEVVPALDVRCNDIAVGFVTKAIPKATGGKFWTATAVDAVWNEHVADFRLAVVD
jgi:hypothetical protein